MRYLVNRANLTEIDALEGIAVARDKVAIDLETVDLDNRLPLGIAVCVAPDLAYYFFDCRDSLLMDLVGRTPVCIFHNAKYDLPILRKLGYRVTGYEDTYILAYSNGMLENNLADLSANILHKECPSVTDQWTDKQKSNIGIDHVEMGRVSMIHACNTYALWEALPKPELYYEIDKPVIELIMEMERWGLLIDQYKTTRLEQGVVTRANQLKAELLHELGNINLGSNPQVLRALQAKGILGTRKTKSGKDSVSDDSLRPLKNPLTDKLLRWRSEQKTLSTYIPAFRDIDHKGRIHTSFGYTETGRFKSRQPNLQNLTKNSKFVEEAE
jgi:DNA polymerase-1